MFRFRISPNEVRRLLLHAVPRSHPLRQAQVPIGPPQEHPSACLPFVQQARSHSQE